MTGKGEGEDVHGRSARNGSSGAADRVRVSANVNLELIRKIEEDLLHPISDRPKEKWNRNSGDRLPQKQSKVQFKPRSVRMKRLKRGTILLRFYKLSNQLAVPGEAGGKSTGSMCPHRNAQLEKGSWEVRKTWVKRSNSEPALQGKIGNPIQKCAIVNDDRNSTTFRSQKRKRASVF